ncbi:hypothetical protein PR048_003149 [Dryococelus australis]|uniref:Uncharacterized protein n=1 Tax=Dryococelus australis TaxID=614101 RepID=A0ABQ9IMB3_9NEOP|nr:hypothetical protein PR048_003149 [Dryococelus australis]
MASRVQGPTRKACMAGKGSSLARYWLEPPECKSGGNGRSRENPQTGGIVRHDSHLQKSGVTRPGIEPGSPWWEASRLPGQPPRPPTRFLTQLRVKCHSTPHKCGFLSVRYKKSWQRSKARKAAQIADSRVKQRRNARVGETGDRRVNPPNSGIVRHDPHLRKSRSSPPGQD